MIRRLVCTYPVLSVVLSFGSEFAVFSHHGLISGLSFQGSFKSLFWAVSFRRLATQMCVSLDAYVFSNFLGSYFPIIAFHGSWFFALNIL